MCKLWNCSVLFWLVSIVTHSEVATLSDLTNYFNAEFLYQWWNLSKKDNFMSSDRTWPETISPPKLWSWFVLFWLVSIVIHSAVATLTCLSDLTNYFNSEFLYQWWNFSEKGNIYVIRRDIPWPETLPSPENSLLWFISIGFNCCVATLTELTKVGSIFAELPMGI